MPLLSLQLWCGDSSALHHPPWLLPPFLCLKLLQCLTLPIHISESRQTTLLARVPSIFHGIESQLPSLFPARSLHLTRTMEMEQAEIRTLPLLPHTPLPQEWVKGGVCVLVRDCTGLGDAEQGLGMPADQGTAPCRQ